MAKVTREQFIVNAMKIHGDRYDYGDVTYVKSSIKIIINCREHGAFEQTPNSHLRGAGCPSCSGNRKRNTHDFVSEAIKRHGDKYDYSSVIYRGGHSKVKIICRTHGAEFEQEANSHLLGCGCPMCAREKTTKSVTKGFHYFVSKSNAIYGNKYKYDESSYVNITTKMRIKCREHGWFEKTPDKHMQGQGCPSCSTSGFDQLKPAVIYFLYSEIGVKVGITNDLTRRMSELKRNTPFNFKLINYVMLTGRDAFMEEKRFHEQYDRVGLSGFDGATEWLKYSPELIVDAMR